MPHSSQHAELRPARNKDARQLDTLYEAGKILTAPSDPAGMLPAVLELLTSFLDLRHGAVVLRDDDAEDGFVVAATALTDVAQPARCGAVPARVAATVLETGVPAVIQNVARELGPEALPPGADPQARMALIAVPLRERLTGSGAEGVLCAYRLRPEAAPLEVGPDLRLLSMIATLMGQTLRFRRIVARDRERLMDEARQASKARPREAGSLPRIIGSGPRIDAVIERVRKAARTRSTVLLRGESGTGKELFAEAIHELSTRKDKPFVRVNCAALSETLLESELFGHEKGAFTGAVGQKKGRFELAEGGTLFLDEIGEISPAFQAKLLRVLQEGEFERVGGTRTVKVDVRLIAATNRDLESAVANGEFRADLYFRICVIPILLPPLRERREDVPPLAESFLDRFNAENGTSLRLSSEALRVLCDCKFPGNGRELENCVNRLGALSQGPTIRLQDMPCKQDACLSTELWRLQLGDRPPAGGLARIEPLPPHRPDPAASDEVPATAREERIDAMERSGWVQAKAARMLGLTPRQIGYALKKHGIDVVKL